MADVINLKQFKKRSEREQSARQADANRARFGRPKPNVLSMNVARIAPAIFLDQHKLDDGDAS